MSARKVSLLPLPSSSLPRPRAFSHAPPRSLSTRKPHFSTNLPLNPRFPLQMPQKNKLPPTSISKRHLLKRQPSHRQNPETVQFDPSLLHHRQGKSQQDRENRVGLSRQTLQLRKESHLNTYFNLRKNKLKDITKENKQIYVRINSQKSLYSSRKLNTSSRSLSSSRSSHASEKSILSREMHNRDHRKGKNTSMKPHIKMVQKNIDRLGKNEINNFLSIFCSNSVCKGIQTKRDLKRVECGKEGKENKGSALERIVQELGAKGRQKVVLPRLIF